MARSIVRLISRPIADSCSGRRAAMSRTDVPTFARSPSWSVSFSLISSSSLVSEPLVCESKDVLIEYAPYLTSKHLYDCLGLEVHSKNQADPGQEAATPVMVSQRHKPHFLAADHQLAP